MKADALLAQIRIACRELGMAQTTFGRLSVNDGKLVSRLGQGSRVTLQTVERVHAFISSHTETTPAELIAGMGTATPRVHLERSFRFYDNRQRYLMFVNTTSERQIVADLAIDEVAQCQPRPPALRLLDACVGDGSALVRILRGLHRRYPWLPFHIVGREVSAENARLMLEKMPDRFQEHPATVLVATNMDYDEAPWLRPTDTSTVLWQTVALKGNTAAEFEEQIIGLRTFLHHNWEHLEAGGSDSSPRRRPVALVLFREDQRFIMDAYLPRAGQARADFDMIVATQPYRARLALNAKVNDVLLPLVLALAPNGRLLGVHSHGDDPGLEIIRGIWPDEDPFQTGRSSLMSALRAKLGSAASDFRFHKLPDARALFQYHLHSLTYEILDSDEEITDSVLFGVWNVAAYIAQIEEVRYTAVVADQSYLEATRAVLERHKRLWFNDEIYVVSRRNTLGRGAPVSESWAN